MYALVLTLVLAQRPSWPILGGDWPCKLGCLL